MTHPEDWHRDANPNGLLAPYFVLVQPIAISRRPLLCSADETNQQPGGEALSGSAPTLISGLRFSRRARGLRSFFAHMRADSGMAFVLVSSVARS